MKRYNIKCKERRRCYLKVNTVFKPSNLTYNILKEIAIHHRPANERDQLGQAVLSLFKILDEPMPHNMKHIILRTYCCVGIVKHSYQRPLYNIKIQIY